MNHTKDPLKTFIGGLVIGGVLMGVITFLVTYAYMQNIIIKTFIL